MVDLTPLAHLAIVGIAGIALAPYLILSLFVGGDSLWAIIPGAIWAAPFAILPAYLRVQAFLEDRRDEARRGR